MTYAQKIDGAWIALPGGMPVRHDGIVASYLTVLAWTDEEREAFGLFAIGEADPIPAGKVSTGSRIETQDGRPVRVHDLADAPVPEILVPNAISDRQFAEVLALDGLITRDEALERKPT